MPQVATQQRPDGVAVEAAGASAVAGADRLGCRSAGQDSGGDRVVDPLAGHRVDQAGRVTGQQQRAVRLAVAPRRQRQVVAAPARGVRRRPGQQRFELRQHLLAGRRTTVADQLAVPDVRQPVAPVERPCVRRLPDIAEHDDLPAGTIRRRRCVPAQRHGLAASHRQTGRGPNQGMRSVSAHDRLRAEQPVQDDAIGTDLERLHPVSAQLRARLDRPAYQPIVEDRPRHHPCRARHLPGDPSSGLVQLQPTYLRPVVQQIRHADRLEDVEHVRCDPVTARLVAWEVGPIQQQHPQVGARGQRAESRRRPGRAGTDHHQIPAFGHRAASITTSMAAMATVAWKARRPEVERSPRKASPSTASNPAQHQSGGEVHGPDERHDRGHHQHRGREPLAGPASELVRQPSYSGGLVVREVRQRVDQMRADAEQRAGHHQPGRRQMSRPDRQRDDGRQRPERQGVRHPGPPGALETQVVGPPGPHSQHQVREAGRQSTQQ